MGGCVFDMSMSGAPGVFGSLGTNPSSIITYDPAGVANAIAFASIQVHYFGYYNPTTNIGYEDISTK